MAEMSGARVIVESLKQQRVRHVFGIPGGAVLPLYDVLYDADIRSILARHEQCVTPDTKILINDTAIVEIGKIEDSWPKQKVITFDLKENSLKSYRIRSYIKEEPNRWGKHVYRLVTEETSREIKATGDHPFWSEHGWAKLEDLKVGDRVAVYPAVEVELEEAHDMEILSEIKVLEKAKLCLRDDRAIKGKVNELKERGLIPLRHNSEKLPIIARILGHLFGDGGLSNPVFDSKRNEFFVYTFFTAKDAEDLKTIKEDLAKLGFRAQRIRKQTRTSYVISRGKRRGVSGKNLQFRSTSKTLWCLFSALGAPIGSKADVEYLIPEWIARGSKKVIREFLAAFNGSETRNPKPKTARNFSAPCIHFHKNKSLRTNAIAFSNQLATLMKTFGIKTRVRMEANHSRRDDRTYCDGFDIYIQGNPENILRFLKLIGYEYCKERKTLATYVSEYLQIRNTALKEYRKKKIEALRLIEGHSRRSVIKELGLTRGMLDNWTYRKRGCNRLPPSSIRPFNEWLKLVTDGLPSGLVWETVAKIEKVPSECVIDIEVEEAHTFIANGFLVHNCAAHMADGYARACGFPGVCIATSGPGATNLVTGIATAYMDSSPIVALTGQVPRAMIGKDAFQEADIVGITTPITKWNSQVKSVGEIPRTIKAAFYIASTGRPGPVLIDFPKDVQTEVREVDFSASINLRGYKPNYDPHPVQVRRAAELLVMAERPMMLVGGGVITSGASQEVLKMAELMVMPVAITLMGKGSIPEDHPLSLGMVGMHGTAEANKLILESDALLVVGVRFSDRTTGKLEQFCPDAEIIHVDIDAAEIGKNAKVDLPIVADAKITLNRIYEQIAKTGAKGERSTWLERVKEVRVQHQNRNDKSRGDQLKPSEVLSELRKMLPNEAIITTEVGQNQMWAALHFKTFEPRTFITSGGLGTMGFGFPASIGAKVAKPDVPVVDIAGDGSFIMTEQDLATSVLEKIPVVVVILNNSMLGMVAQWQRLFYNRRYAGSKLGGIPDFVKLAEAYGAQGFRAGSIAEFSSAVRKALESDVTTVIDVPISPEENVFPMVPSGSGLKDMMVS